MNNECPAIDSPNHSYGNCAWCLREEVDQLRKEVDRYKIQLKMKNEKTLEKYEKNHTKVLKDIKKALVKTKDKFVASGFFKKETDKGITGYTFIPKSYKTLEAAKKGAIKFFHISPSSIMFIQRKDGKFTFVPRTGDAATMIYRTAKACEGKIIGEDIICIH